MHLYLDGRLEKANGHIPRGGTRTLRRVGTYVHHYFTRMTKGDDQFPNGSGAAKAGRLALNAVSGLVPFAGGLLSAAASEWSEREQDKINAFLRHWLEM